MLSIKVRSAETNSYTGRLVVNESIGTLEREERKKARGKERGREGERERGSGREGESGRARWLGRERNAK